MLLIGIVQFFVVVGFVLLGMAGVGAYFKGDLYAQEIFDFSIAGGISLLAAILILVAASCVTAAAKRPTKKSLE